MKHGGKINKKFKEMIILKLQLCLEGFCSLLNIFSGCYCLKVSTKLYLAMTRMLWDKVDYINIIFNAILLDQNLAYSDICYDLVDQVIY